MKISGHRMNIPIAHRINATVSRCPVQIHYFQYDSPVNEEEKYVSLSSHEL